MKTYDDKTKDTIESNGRFILSSFNPCDEAIFKASYIVVSDIYCDGKITALFDLIIIGNINAEALEINGRFICIGKCNVRGSIIVQEDILAEEIHASSIEAHDKIIVEEIEVNTIYSNNNIIVGKILTINKLAESAKNILCGETVYGAGKIKANTLITAEPIDMDEGNDAIMTPYIYPSSPKSISEKAISKLDLISKGLTEFEPLGNWYDYLIFLINTIDSENEKHKFTHWIDILAEVENIIKNGTIDSYKNVGLLIWMTEIINSNYFKQWGKIGDLFNELNSHFVYLVHNDTDNIIYIIDNFGEWIDALKILYSFGELIDAAIYNVAYTLLFSNLGLKSKFVFERLNEKGWKTYGKQ